MKTDYFTLKKANEISIKVLDKSEIFKDIIGTWNYSLIDGSMTDLKITYSFHLKFPYRIIKSKIS